MKVSVISEAESAKYITLVRQESGIGDSLTSSSASESMKPARPSAFNTRT